jgi:hypothetical protein
MIMGLTNQNQTKQEAPGMNTLQKRIERITTQTIIVGVDTQIKEIRKAKK